MKLNNTIRKIKRMWYISCIVFAEWLRRGASITDGIVCRTFVLILCVTLYTTFRPIASPAVVRCWLVLRRTGWCMAFRHVRVTTFECLAVLGKQGDYAGKSDKYWRKTSHPSLMWQKKRPSKISRKTTASSYSQLWQCHSSHEQRGVPIPASWRTWWVVGHTRG